MTTRHPQWRETLSPVDYPFADGMSLTNAQGTRLPRETFLDAVLHPVGALPPVYLSRLDIVGEQVRLVLGDGNTSELASGVLDLSTAAEHVPLVDVYGRAAGLLVSDATRLAAFQSLPQGSHAFNSSQTEFAARVLLPAPEPGLRGFLLDDGSVVAGDVWLVGENGVVLRHETRQLPPAGPAGEPETVHVVRVDVVGDELYRRRLCNQIFVTPRVLRTLTFRQGDREVVCGPDSLGNVSVAAGTLSAPDSILRVRSTREGLVIEAVGQQLEGA